MSKRPIKSLKGTKMELIKKIQINKTKTPSSPFRLLEKHAVGVESGFRERKSDFSLDFSTFGPSVLVGPRSKVVLRCKGYAWAPIL